MITILLSSDALTTTLLFLQSSPAVTLEYLHNYSIQGNSEATVQQ